MNRITTVVAIFLALTFGLFAQQTQAKPEKTKDQLFQDAEKAYKELLVKMQEMDKMFPGDEPMTPMVIRDHEEFLKNVKFMEETDVMLADLKKKSEESQAKVDASMKRVDELRAKECTEVRNDLSTGKVSPLIKDVWQEIAKHCDEQDKAKLANTPAKK
jgi:hypothetical protein